jgi:hypothetical protein
MPETEASNRPALRPVASTPSSRGATGKPTSTSAAAATAVTSVGSAAASGSSHGATGTAPAEAGKSSNDHGSKSPAYKHHCIRQTSPPLKILAREDASKLAGLTVQRWLETKRWTSGADALQSVLGSVGLKGFALLLLRLERWFHLSVPSPPGWSPPKPPALAGGVWAANVWVLPRTSRIA